MTMPAGRLSRRGFLQSAALGLAGLAMPGPLGRGTSFPTYQLGRVAESSVDIHREPFFSSEKAGIFYRDDVFPVYAAVIGDPLPEHNRVWYEVAGLGFVHSSPVQPVRDERNTPAETIPEEGLLGEVTVPFVDVRRMATEQSFRSYRYYYKAAFWIRGVVRESEGHSWYRVWDDLRQVDYFAPADSFRLVPPEELAPLSPEVPPEEKRVEVDLAHQWMKCYEGAELVFTSKISSGWRYASGYYLTPVGDFQTYHKRHSRHMAGGNLATGYDLPGVPWVAYINNQGISFHGTYWHNDFGRPRSHGCINMAPEAAMWFHRWSQPAVPAETQEIRVDYGTRVRITA
ncbi:MAG: hypothetical protein A2Z66_10850 [Chloroflexi bacterium RBG_13_66_10]|nr:MAG: hypothetical protein A2Z66_10850 [Chloroflexi bacterium RBG_13_66_10]